MISRSAPAAVLVATLGAEPQIIPITVQLILRQRIPLAHVDVLHTTPDREPIQSALAEMEESFARHSAWPGLVRTQLACADVLTPQELDHFSLTLFTSLKGWIGRGVQVHLLLAGGRKPMAMLGMSVAQLLLGPTDRVWYLFSSEELRLSGRAAIENDDDARLIQIPLPVFSPAPALFGRSFRAETPEAARRELTEAAAERCRYFVEKELTPAERSLARWVALDVLTVDELAARLHKSPKTITNQLNSIYGKLESVFGLQPDKGVKREFLRQVLSVYFAAEPQRGAEVFS